MPATPIIVSPVHKNLPTQGNAYLLARLELSPPTVLVLTVIPIAKTVMDPLTSNVHRVLRVVLFSALDVVYRHVAIKPNSSIRQLRHARVATRAARAAPVRGVVHVWGVGAVTLCLMDNV